MAKVLVTGANGFLGSNLVRRLNQEGHHVRILVRSTSDLSELDGCQFEKFVGDVTDVESLRKAVVGIETVFHLAGVIAYRRADRSLMEKVNVGGTANLLTALQGSGVSRLVDLSSVVAIGAGFRPDQILNEESEYNVGSLHLGYFDTKHQAEMLVRQACVEKKVDAVILNPSTIYGAGDALKGTRKTQVKVAQGKFPFYTRGGVNIIHVDDCVEGILSAWKKGRTGERYILSGENLLLKDVFDMIAQEAGVASPKMQMPSWALFTLGWVGDRMTDVGMKGPVSTENAWTSQMYHWFDNAKARRELGLDPRPARVALHDSVNWMKEKGIL